jgi:AAA15 family ATPase/GTPase
MFTNLHLGQHKGLTSGWLRNLGRINIICGKNNSGKSTVLEAINFTFSSSPALQLTNSELDQIFKLLTQLRLEP